MTFDDLPENWDTLPLTDTVLATDVVDLTLGDRDRHLNSMLFLLCDDNMRLLQPIAFGGVEWNCSALERRRTLEFLAHLPVGGVIIAVSSAHPMPEDVVERWRRTAVASCTETGPILLHFFSATPHALPDHVWQARPPGIAS